MSRLLIVLLVVANFSNGFEAPSLLGSWMLVGSADLPEHIIFKSDSTYAIYVPGTHGKIKVKAREGSEMILVEKGKWIFLQNRNKLHFVDRAIIEKSEFVDSYGEGDLTLFTKDLSVNGFSLCRSLDNVSCDKYSSYSKYSLYKEISTLMEGSASKVERIALSGYETKMYINQRINSGAICVEDQMGRLILGDLKVDNSKTKSTTLELTGVTELVVKVTSNDKSNWQISIKVL